MIDLIKIFNLELPVSKLLNNPFLDFPLNAFVSGELNNRNQSCDYRNIIFTINQSRNSRKLKGSLHYYFNNGIHNYNDFTYFNLLWVIMDLVKKFEIDPEIVSLNCIEFGVNLIVDFDPKDLFDNIIQHWGVPFYPFEKGTGIQCEHSQYRFKIYNKSYQFGLRNHIIRIEIHVNRMDYFNWRNIPISTLADLMIRKNLILLKDDLLNQFNLILFYDNTIDRNRLTDKELYIMSEIRRQGYWKEKRSKNDKDVFLRQYKRILEKYSHQDWKSSISKMMEEKLNLLLEMGDQSILATNVAIPQFPFLGMPGEISQPDRKGKMSGSDSTGNTSELPLKRESAKMSGSDFRDRIMTMPGTVSIKSPNANAGPEVLP